MSNRDLARYWRLVTAAMLLAVVMLLLVLGSSCRVSKYKSATVTDSTAVNVSKETASSAAVNKTDSSYEWWRTIVQYPRTGDTIINKIYPTTIIYESGKGVMKTEESKEDTVAKETNTAVSVSTSEVVKEKESEPINIWWLLAIWGGWEVLKLVWSFIKTKYSITIKS